jgi:alpha-ketoglutarate-dependent taurine dioxygenase
MVSSLAIHDVIQAERPELLPALYEGFYHEADGEVSREKVPVFARVDGKLSCYHHPLFAMRAAKLMGVELPPELVEANDFLNAVAARPEIRADFMLEPGEMLFWHNFTALHSRRQFRDTPEHKRLLLRLWINVVDGRPMPQAFRDRAILMDRAHGAGQTGLNYAAGPVSTR